MTTNMAGHVVEKPAPNKKTAVGGEGKLQGFIDSWIDLDSILTCIFNLFIVSLKCVTTVWLYWDGGTSRKIYLSVRPGEDQMTCYHALICKTLNRSFSTAWHYVMWLSISLDLYSESGESKLKCERHQAQINPNYFLNFQEVINNEQQETFKTDL